MLLWSKQKISSSSPHAHKVSGSVVGQKFSLLECTDISVPVRSSLDRLMTLGCRSVSMCLIMVSVVSPGGGTLCIVEL